MRPQFRERVGKTLADKYKLQRLLGVGGMSAVYEAENTWTGRRVAIKLLTADADGDAERAQRFMKEARAATAVEHPNIVQVLDMGRDPADDTLFIVEEFLDGSDLRAVLDEREILPPRAALEIIVPVMSAVAAANKQGIVHRDVKPANIFCARGTKGELIPKVIDFGVVKTGTGNEITKTGTTIGTPEYMSPEQANGDPSMDAQTDVWSTGVVLYEMLAGSCPFAHENYHSLLVQILWNPIPRLDVANPDVPAEFADVVHRALERDRAVRFKSMGEFLDAVLDCPAFASEAWHRALVDAQRPVAQVPPSDSAHHVVPSLPPPVSHQSKPTVDRDDPTTERRPVVDAPAPIASSTFDGHIPTGGTESAPIPIVVDDAELDALLRPKRRITFWRGATLTGIVISVVIGLVAGFGSNRAVVRALRTPAPSAATAIPTQPASPVVVATHQPEPVPERTEPVAAVEPSPPVAPAPAPTVAPTPAAPEAPPVEPAAADAGSGPDLVFDEPEPEPTTPATNRTRVPVRRGRATSAPAARAHRRHVQHTANGAPILGVP